MAESTTANQYASDSGAFNLAPIAGIAQAAAGAFASYEQASTASKLAKKIGGSSTTYIVLGGVALLGVVAFFALKK